MAVSIATGMEALPQALLTASFTAGELSRSAKYSGDGALALMRVSTRTWFSATKPPCRRRNSSVTGAALTRLRWPREDVLWTTTHAFRTTPTELGVR